MITTATACDECHEPGVATFVCDHGEDTTRVCAPCMTWHCPTCRAEARPKGRLCDPCARDEHSNCRDPEICLCPCYCSNCESDDSCWVCECNCRYCLGYRVDRDESCKYWQILPS